ncbi:ricin B lectin domain-containing protein [Spinellus fusiger]|nr:ricin B lectin domain-containing protein [Spinellus fusiger]
MVHYIPSTPFYITSQFNGKVIDVEGASEEDGAHIIIWEKKPGANPNQLFNYRHGFFVNVNSGKVLDIKGGKIRSNSHIIQYAEKSTEEDTSNQCWTIDHEGYIHTESDPSLVLDIRGADDCNGAEVILYVKKEGEEASNQRWNLEPFRDI